MKGPALAAAILASLFGPAAPASAVQAAPAAALSATQCQALVKQVRGAPDRAARIAGARDLAARCGRFPSALGWAAIQVGFVGLNEEAIGYLDRAIAIRPDPIDLFNRSLFRPKDDLVARLADVDAALALATGARANIAGAVHAERGRVLMGMGRIEEALAAFTAGYAASPEDYMILLERGVAHAALGKADLAAADDAAAQAQFDAEGFMLACRVKARARTMLADALAACDRATAGGTNADALVDKGLALLRLNRDAEAAGTFATATALRPDKGAARFGHAVALARLHDPAASAERAAALALEPWVARNFAFWGAGS